MPAVSQVGKLPGGGDFGLKHRKHAVTGGRIANAIPYVAMAPPYTNGTFDSIAASLIRKRVSRLSVPSTTTSTPFRISRTVAEWTSLETGSIWISEFTERRRSAAASAFGRSTSRSAYSSCRWRFVSSTTSRSTSRRCPTPARARRSDEMLPRAPNPTTTARALASLRWPSTPISGRTSCRRYRFGGRTVGERARRFPQFAQSRLIFAGQQPATVVFKGIETQRKLAFREIGEIQRIVAIICREHPPNQPGVQVHKHIQRAGFP